MEKTVKNEKGKELSMVRWKKVAGGLLFLSLVLIFLPPHSEAAPYDATIQLSKDPSGTGGIVFDVTNNDQVNGSSLYRGTITAPFVYSHDVPLSCYLEGSISEYTITENQVDGNLYYYILSSYYNEGSGCETTFGVNSDPIERGPLYEPSFVCPVDISGDAGADGLICAGTGDSVVLGGDPLYSCISGDCDIEWSPTTGLDLTDPEHPEATPGTDTTYTLTVTDNLTGCTAESEVFVEVIDDFVVDAGPDTPSQCGSPVMIGGTPAADGGSGDFTYVWSPPDGLDDPTSPNPTASPSSETTYELTVTDNIYGCEGTDTVLVEVTGGTNPECGGALDWGPLVGDCAQDWNPPSALINQNSEMISLSDYECDVVLLVLSAMW